MKKADTEVIVLADAEAQEAELSDEEVRQTFEQIVEPLQDVDLLSEIRQDLSPEECEQLKRAAWSEYEQVAWGVWDEREKLCRQAWEHRSKITNAIWQEFDQAIAPARAWYGRLEEQARLRKDAEAVRDIKCEYAQAVEPMRRQRDSALAVAEAEYLQVVEGAQRYYEEIEAAVRARRKQIIQRAEPTKPSDRRILSCHPTGVCSFKHTI